MAKTFLFRARDQQGRMVSGTLTAENEAAVAAYIRSKSLFVAQIKEERQTSSLWSSLERFRSVSTKDIAIFCRQFAAMADAGLPLLTALNVLQQQATSTALRTAVQAVHIKVQEGYNLTTAMKDHPQVFPQVMIGLIHAGESGGTMDVVLQRLALHYEKENKIQQKLRSAMTYPAVVGFVAFTAVVFILTFVFPTFISLFSGMKISLPWITQQMISFSTVLQEYWSVLMPLALVVPFAAGAAYRRMIPLRRIVDGWIGHVPVLGNLVRNVAVARVSRTLATLLRGGMPLLTALEVTRKAMTNSRVAQALAEAYSGVTEGITLAACFQAHPIFPPLVVQMVAVGEESGEVDHMLDRIADFYEAEVDETVNRLSSIVEPVMILIMGGIVGLIVASVMLPMFDLVTGMGR